MGEKFAASSAAPSRAGSRERIGNILGSMQVKLKEIDSLRKELSREQSGGLSARQSLQMLEEIKVPSLEVLRDDKKKR